MAAATAFALDSPALAWRFRWLPALQALLGALGGAVLFAALLRLGASIEVPEGDLARLLLLAPVACWLAALAASQLLNPILLHYDRRLGSLFETLRSGFAAAAAALLVLTAFWMFDPENSPTPSALFGVLALSAMTAMGARIGSMLGALGHQRPLGRTLGGLVAGSALGAAASTAVALIGFRLSSSQPLEEVLARSWVVSIPTAVGLGLMFSRVDLRPPFETPRRSLSARVATLTLAATAALAMAMLTDPLEIDGPGKVVLPDPMDKGKVRSEAPTRLQLDRIPFEVYFELHAAQDLRAELTYPAAKQPPDLVLELFAGQATDPLESEDDPELIDKSLKKGSYRLRVRRYGSDSGDFAITAESSSEFFLGTMRRLLPWLDRWTTKPFELEVAFVTAKQRPRPRMVRDSGSISPAGAVQVGDQIRIAKPQEVTTALRWDPEMDNLLSQPMTIQSIDTSDMTVEVEENSWWWHLSWVVQLKSGDLWLTPVARPVPTRAGAVEVGMRVRFRVPARAGTPQAEMARLARGPLTIEALFTDGARTYAAVTGSADNWPVEWIETIERGDEEEQ